MAKISSVVSMQPLPDLSTGRHKVVRLAAFGSYPKLTSKFIASTLLFAFSIPASAHAKLADVRCDDSARLTQTLTQVMGTERQGMRLRDPETMLEV
ncbi:hypothetical protein [Sulfitobacter aestuariivivens]|uniref:Uncharacterized protein n=1 Tax=Sulfitobacter aestuariivivens TaxID=2766981 RepID=A0A927D5T6_9RHOB|nr:hypothetical protein [Sulfitobacter aestuariivivens]MBD3665730.1 hypothetical protein [Sulfitobacter aestuariivivens]